MIYKQTRFMYYMIFLNTAFEYNMAILFPVTLIFLMKTRL